ncbi:MAG: fumarylacetoacetate hydrolase family protein [candidate division KSB1 bacterium]|nr:fumarylacetoacetate hydrolase family protein [candidate division KSB1 bacterium]MDZ7273555.1 fumarylacetoacetate hydrolase family protein [candidate division KSB1 bacterium]MDZ7286854.1 fumarylacetoacetate hydrolase family protein [candidate division KSB1 bacterium]MDZ7299789.1 fumarylacetoacetate hydrolase family protein [candidate division KSB1 bacterium]MDZ7350885.1 fumarylacetoacetate hydrolase family protein [candidate division KSB1 bacterium]
MNIFRTLINLVFVAVALNCALASAESKKIVRYQDQAGAVHYGLVKEDKVHQLKGGIEAFARGKYELDGKILPLAHLKILAPAEPSKVINFGWTYPQHAQEVGGQVQRNDPLVFLKPPTVIIAHRDTIRYPHGLSRQVEFEGELAIIIGKHAKNLTPENALDCVLGYTCFNDVTARDLTQSDPEFTRGKGFDTFGPLGPWIVTEIDPRDLRLTTTLNGEKKQDARTSQMSYGIPFLISYISQVMTLNPGDVIATGTPAGSAAMKPGDVVKIEIEHIGELVNYVK